MSAPVGGTRSLTDGSGGGTAPSGPSTTTTRRHRWADGRVVRGRSRNRHHSRRRCNRRLTTLRSDRLRSGHHGQPRATYGQPGLPRASRARRPVPVARQRRRRYISSRPRSWPSRGPDGRRRDRALQHGQEEGGGDHPHHLSDVDLRAGPSAGLPTLPGSDGAEATATVGEAFTLGELSFQSGWSIGDKRLFGTGTITGLTTDAPVESAIIDVWPRTAPGTRHHLLHRGSPAPRSSPACPSGGPSPLPEVVFRRSLRSEAGDPQPPIGTRGEVTDELVDAMSSAAGENPEPHDDQVGRRHDDDLLTVVGCSSNRRRPARSGSTTRPDASVLERQPSLQLLLVTPCAVTFTDCVICRPAATGSPPHSPSCRAN